MLAKLHLILLLLAVASLFSLLAVHNTYIRPFRPSNSVVLNFGKANPSSQSIVHFWAEWARIFDEAKPIVKPIEIVWNASIKNSKNATGERKPTPQSIGLSKEDVESLRRSHAQVVDHPAFKSLGGISGSLYNGTGIVTVAGGALLGPAILSIRMLRRVNSTLPVHVFLQSHEFEREICEEMLPSLNAECYIIEDFLREDTPLKVKTYQLKPLAMLFTSFESVIWMDADCIPLRDPAELLASEPFQSTGLVTWPDYWIATEDRIFYTIAGLDSYPKGLPAKSTESGQLLIDKKRHLSTLLLAVYYNLYGPSYYYQILGQGAPGEGDKETFLAAAVALGQPQYRVKHDLTALGFREEKTRRFHGKGMVQYHPSDDYAQQDARAFFLHANTPKMNAGHLLYEEDELCMPETRKRIRIWGTEQSTVGMFGFDVERVVWQELVSMACELQSILSVWSSKKRLCQKAKSHFEAVFQGDNHSQRV